MTTALILSLALVCGIAIGGLEWAWRIERRTARRETRQTWTVTPASEVDHTLDDPLTEYEQAAWREFERED